MSARHHIALVAALAAVIVITAGCGPKQVADNTTACPVVDRAAPPAPANAQKPITVYVPCGIAGPYGDVCDLLKRTDPQLTIRDKIANTTALMRLLLDGKGKCDVLLAFGNIEVNILKQAGLVAKAVPIAGNGLGLIVQKGNPLGITGVKDLVSKKVKAIAIASDNTSVGFYAEQALKNAGIWDQVKSKVARTEMPVELKAFVMKRKADAAIIYRTCMVEVYRPGQERLGENQGISTKLEDVGVIDPALHDPFYVHAVLLKNASNPQAAERFIAAWTSPEGQDILADWDFLPLEKASAAQ